MPKKQICLTSESFCLITSHMMRGMSMVKAFDRFSTFSGQVDIFFNSIQELNILQYNLQVDRKYKISDFLPLIDIPTVKIGR